MGFARLHLLRSRGGETLSTSLLFAESLTTRSRPCLRRLDLYLDFLPLKTLMDLPTRTGYGKASLEVETKGGHRPLHRLITRSRPWFRGRVCFCYLPLRMLTNLFVKRMAHGMAFSLEFW